MSADNRPGLGYNLRPGDVAPRPAGWLALEGDSMNRRAFLKRRTLGGIGMATLATFGEDLKAGSGTTATMPVIFVGHGNPMNALEDNDFSRAWTALGSALPRPRAILCISAHWETDGTRVTAMPKPRTIHDFWGFPPELYEKQYPAPGAPDWAEITRETIRSTRVDPDPDWGLDHGTWSVLCHMFPKADVPVFQLSLDRTQPPQRHYEIGRDLAPLRERGLLIVGSGNMVHNLSRMEWTDTPFAWATEFDAKLKSLIASNDHEALIHYDRWGGHGGAVHSHQRALPAAALCPGAAEEKGGARLLHGKSRSRLRLHAWLPYRLRPFPRSSPPPPLPGAATVRSALASLCDASVFTF